MRRKGYDALAFLSRRPVTERDVMENEVLCSFRSQTPVLDFRCPLSSIALGDADPQRTFQSNVEVGARSSLPVAGSKCGELAETHHLEVVISNSWDLSQELLKQLPSHQAGTPT
eukprot:TRINITY_DN52052_c0_g1_i1.p1 TRINITY_DN52052_c0_g1~~TRINITY_DN52052_c0_g1_i1.p1  ORF type:complete len:114 (+),score=11.54 TRINITY_DN52052_c0_g1_i1:249-590(+)